MWWSEDNCGAGFSTICVAGIELRSSALVAILLPTEPCHQPTNHHAIPCKQTGKCWNSDCFTTGLTGDLTVLWFHIYLCKINVQQWFSQGSFLFRNLVKMFLNIAGSLAEAIRCLRAIVVYSHRWTQQNFSWQVFKSGVARLDWNHVNCQYRMVSICAHVSIPYIQTHKNNVTKHI